MFKIGFDIFISCSYDGKELVVRALWLSNRSAGSEY